jgi:hypothetical protein
MITPVESPLEDEELGVGGGVTVGVVTVGAVMGPMVGAVTVVPGLNARAWVNPFVRWVLSVVRVLDRAVI